MNTELDDRFIMSPAPGGEMRDCADTGILLLEKSRRLPQPQTTARFSSKVVLNIKLAIATRWPQGS